MPEMQQQIDAFREVSSADMNKPFVLKPTFPYANLGALVNTTHPRLDMDGMAAVESLVWMPTGQRSSQQPITSGVPIAGQSPWNNSSILCKLPRSSPPLYTVLTFTQVKSFGTNPAQTTSGPLQTSNLPAWQLMDWQQYPIALISSPPSPSMGQESIASVYKGGLMRRWGYDGGVDE